MAASVFTNLSVYLAIAEEALAESTRLLEGHRIPKPDGRPGYVLFSDPERKSFKQSLIAIAFAGIYLDALLGLTGRAQLGEAVYEEIERKHYEVKLKRLGIDDQCILASCTRFRKARNDLMHETAVYFETMGALDIRVAQEEAILGVEFVKSMANKLQPTP